MISSYTLFTSSFCAGCPAVKKFMAKQELKGVVVDCSDGETEESIGYGVMSLPTVIFFDENAAEVGRAYSVNEIREILTES